MLLVFRNKKKEAEAEAEKDPNKLKELVAVPDVYLICGKQRHFTWEGRIGLWFDRGSQQLLESPGETRRYIDFGTCAWKQEWRRS